MNRKTFIKLTSLAAVGTFFGLNALAENVQHTSAFIINIEKPKIHVRHGLFNLHTATFSEKIGIQRDIFNRNGLAEISDDRMTTIKLKNGKNEVFALLQNDIFESDSPQLTAFQLQENETFFIDINAEMLIFSEFHDFYINDMKVQIEPAFLKKEQGKIKLFSKTKQYIFVYQLLNLTGFYSNKAISVML